MRDDDFSVLVCPVDMPLINSDVLVNLMKHRDLAAVVKFRGFELPAIFANTIDLRTLLGAMCQPSQQPAMRSFRNLYKQLPVFEIELDSAEAFANTNTREEWQHALSATNNPSPN